ncbi:hypothetical protein RJT34_25179 [Clitoria ternatea]|uniref:Transcription repressor n=1 Tax=Clitoria ternatea TaxID=43366 RepID=A0AAN9II92_CLITE
MPSVFSKHLHLCFFKLKYPTILCQPHQETPPPSTDNSTTMHNHSLYDTTDHYFSSSSTTTTSSSSSDSIEPDFASIFASQRFFFSSPGTSNSIIESPDTRTFIPTGGGVKVPKYSLNPYVDFLRSMQEMISSHQVLDVRKDWDYLHELLLCYLALNPPHTHKYIVHAFTDLIVQLLSSSSTSSLMRNKRRHKSFSGSSDLVGGMLIIDKGKRSLYWLMGRKKRILGLLGGAVGVAGSRGSFVFPSNFSGFLPHENNAPIKSRNKYKNDRGQGKG